MFNPDKSIISSSQDLLNRSNFAKKIGNAILAYKETESIVIGLLGEWGYGKTSIVNMTIEHINSISDEDDDLILLKFNPWIYSEQNKLIENFFYELSLKLPRYSPLRAKLNKYANKLTPIVLSTAAIIDPTRTQALMKSVEGIKSLQSVDKNLESLKNELNDLIVAKNIKIIVFIDDIDRLYDYEIRQVFQLVNLLADFSNTVYLLSFERNIVINALNKVQEGQGERYLDKIVQVPFEVPKIDKTRIETILFTEIDEIIQDVSDRFDVVYLGNVYESGLKYLFGNLRDINKYINYLKFSFELVKEEVDPVDFLAISAIQIFIPSFYHEIKYNKELFTELLDNPTLEQKEEQKTLFEELINSVKDSHQKPLNDLLHYLFPKLGTFYRNMIISPEFYGTWRRELRVCSPDNFDTYFMLDVAPEEISNREIQKILSTIDDPALFSECILNLIQTNKILRFLDRLKDYLLDIDENNIENIVSVLFDLGDLFPESKSGFLGILDTPMKILQIVNVLLKRLDTQEKRFNVLKKAIEGAEQSIHILEEEVIIRDQEHGRYNLKESPKPEEDRITNSEQLNKLEVMALEKIHLWASERDLEEHENLVSILFSWCKWEDRENVINYVSSIIETDEGLTNFITKFLRGSYKYTFGDRFSKPTWQMSIEDISKFVVINDIIPRIERITQQRNFKDLSENDKRKIALEKFLKKTQN